jgi:transposase-like protein
MIQERGVFVDLVTVHRWTLKIFADFGPRLSQTKASCRHQLADG